VSGRRRGPALALLAAAGAAALLAPAARGEVVDRIVLRVNDRIVTLYEYEARRGSRLRALEAAEGLSAEDRRTLAADAGRATMRELYEEALVLSRAEQLGLVADPAEVDRAVDSAQRRFGIPDDAEFARALAGSGSSIEEFRARMERQLLLNQVAQREVAPRVQVDEAEVERYWTDHPDEFTRPERRRVVEAIVRDTAPGAPEERRALAARIRDELVGGATVAGVVERLGVGEDRVLVLEHGWIERGELEPTLDAAVWELGAGGVAGPLDGRGGLHVVHLLEVEAAAVRPLDEVREEITGKLRDEEFGEESTAMVDRLGRAAYLVESLPEDATGYRTVELDDRDPLRALMRDAPAAVEEPVPVEPEPPGSAQSKRN
jgi:parvulin-like peptidyl-prolyl isomerase